MSANNYFRIDRILYGFLLAFILIASCGAYPQVGVVAVFYLGILIPSIACIIYMRSSKLPKQVLRDWLIFFTLFSVLLGLRGEWLSNPAENKNLFKIIFLAPVLYALTRKSYREVMKIYVAVFNIMLIMSLAGLALTYIYPAAYKLVQYTGKYSGVTTTYFYSGDITTRTFFGLHFIKSFGLTIGIHRNQGLFWEPGVYSFVICWMYVIKNCFLMDKKNNWLYYVTEITTLSAAGILIFCIFFTYVNYFHGKGERRSRDLLFLIAGFVVMMTLFVKNENLVEDFLIFWGGIFGRDFYNDSSAIIRWRDFYYGIQAALDRPLWGHGWNFDNYNSVLVAEVNAGKPEEWGGITNSVVGIFYKYGIFYWVFYMSLLWRFSIRLAEYKPWGFMLFLGFIATLMHEPLDMSIFVLAFLIYPPPIHELFQNQRRKNLNRGPL